MIYLFVRKPRGFKNLRVAPFNVRNETGDYKNRKNYFTSCLQLLKCNLYICHGHVYKHIRLIEFEYNFSKKISVWCPARYSILRRDVRSSLLKILHLSTVFHLVNQYVTQLHE